MTNSISVSSKGKPGKKQAELFALLKADIQSARFEHSYTDPLHFLSFLSDRELQGQLKELKKKKDTQALKTVFVLGIGGANLGAKAIIDAMGKKQSREFIFLDTVYLDEADELHDYVERIDTIHDFLLIIVSKSGETLETVTNAHLLGELLREKFGSIDEQTIVVSVADSPLSIEAKESDILCIDISQAISDRFSVFSPTALVPLMFADFSLDDFVRGGMTALHEFDHESGVWDMALLLDSTFPVGIHGILDFFLFSPRLETLGKWNRQLFAESLGKELTLDGELLDRSITPTVSLGTTDLHSMLQLYLAQPHERAAWFFFVDDKTPSHDSKDPEHVLSAIYQSVVSEYKKHNIPFADSHMDSIGDESLGYTMMNSFLVVLALARLWDVNPFDQPNVEEYKDEARKMI